MSFIKLDRKIQDWEWFKDGNMLKVWIYLLTEAEYQDETYRGREIKKGQLITGRKKIAKECGISEQEARTCINRLKSTNEITTESTNKDTLITIVNWGKYQGDTEKSTNESTNKDTNEQPTNNQQTTTIQEYKNNKNFFKKLKNVFMGDYMPTYDDKDNPQISDERLEEILNGQKSANFGN